MRNLASAQAEQHALAALSQRVLLTLAESTASNRIAIEAVSKHMRYLRGILNRSVLWTAVPSEPVLAIAAARAMFGEYTAVKRLKNETYQETIEVLVNRLILQQDVVDRGTMGELASRLILTMAHDAVLVSNSFICTDENRPAVRTVSLLKFLQELLPEAQWGKLPDDLDEYVLNFTHFIQMSKNIY